MPRKLFISLALSLSILFLLFYTDNVLAFDMFGINAPDIGENLAEGSPQNAQNWPTEIIQAIQADQAAAIEKMEKSGYKNWDIVRSVRGKVLGVDVEKHFWKRWWEMLISFIKRVFGIASDRYNFEGSDVILGPRKCPPPKFERDPITGKNSEIKIFGILVDLENEKKVKADITMSFQWDFLGGAWNCTPGNPEGTVGPELAAILPTVISDNAHNINYPADLGSVKKNIVDAAGTPLEIRQKAEREIGAKAISLLNSLDDGQDDQNIQADLEIKLSEELNCDFHSVLSVAMRGGVLQSYENLNEESEASCREQARQLCSQHPDLKDILEEETNKLRCPSSCPIKKITKSRGPLAICSTRIPIGLNITAPFIYPDCETSQWISCEKAPTSDKNKQAPQQKPQARDEEKKESCVPSEFYACIDGGGPGGKYGDCNPTNCIETCPFIPVECPPETSGSVTEDGDTTIIEEVSCADRDPACIDQCWIKTRACENDCFTATNCASSQVPPRF